VRDNQGEYFLAVEAKADEPFGDTVSDTLAAALERKLESQKSNGIARVEQLAAAILGPRQATETKTGELRYQLLTACAGAMCEAERMGCSRAILMVHEFITKKTKDQNHHRNAADLDCFLGRLSHQPSSHVHVGSLVGPFTVPGTPLIRSHIRLYIGKASRNLRM
jgi:hypothetical protein